MAGQRKIEGISPELPFAAAAAAVVETRTEELLAHSEGVLDTGEISHLHDMRVATRRLRAALEVFAPCFPKAAHKRLRKQVKGIADALGERRDRDVAINSLAEFAESLPRPDRPGVASLIDRYRDEQRRANEAIAPVIETRQLVDLGRRARELTAAARELAREQGEPPPGPGSEPAPGADPAPQPRAGVAGPGASLSPGPERGNGDGPGPGS